MNSPSVDNMILFTDGNYFIRKGENMTYDLLAKYRKSISKQTSEIHHQKRTIFKLAAEKEQQEKRLVQMQGQIKVLKAEAEDSKKIIKEKTIQLEKLKAESTLQGTLSDILEETPTSKKTTRTRRRTKKNEI